MPLGQIDLPVTFEGPANFRLETLTFEVVGFHGAYHAILGQPCYAKFIVVPNYTYLKLKMPGSKGVITVGAPAQHTYHCEVECGDVAAATVASMHELAVLQAQLAEGTLDSNKGAQSFKPVEKSKEVLLDPSDDKGKVARVGTSLTPK